MLKITKQLKTNYILLTLTIVCSLTQISGFAEGNPKVSPDAKISKGQLIDGTYIGKSFKFPWWMHVSVTIENGRMTKIEVLKHKAPKRYTDLMQELADKIIRNQSTQVDAISGATISSNALKRAVSDALKKAAAPHNP
jgi:uncharacterized protein with FMN-binding domain